MIAAQPGGSKAALERTRQYFRFFLAPGMSHLTGGTGPDSFGSPYGQPALRDDRVHDVFRALEAWVEQGIAPDRIVATKYVNDTPAIGAARTRPLCPYPKLARYSGTGNPDDAASFDCVDGPRGAYLD